MEPPPPPPPHGANSPGGGKSGGLPDGKYDIFVIPPHSSGSGFLYLPSLQTQRNSFLAGVFCTASAFFIYYTAVPIVKQWLFSTLNSGGTGVFTLVCGVAVVAWAFGKTQNEWQQPGTSSNSGPSAGTGGQGQGHAGYGNTGSYTQSGSHSHPPPPNHGANVPPQSSWQQPPPQANSKANTTNAKTSWEKAREETRKREEERKRAEELKKRRDELEKERQRQKDELEKERSKAREKELRERLEREIKEKREKEGKEAATKAAAEKIAAGKVAAERERLEKQRQDQAARGSPKRPPMPTAATERDDDAYSFRPYDRPKRTHKANSAASMYSESSYAPSVSTTKTTPPPSMRGPYSTKDPDKIVIKGVFSFNNAFMRTPISQLRSGHGSVTDGLILRITTEGLFIDDDVRGVPQREWDVKAWTMKSAEVWCPSVSPPGSFVNGSPQKRKISLGFGLHADSRRDPASPSQTESSAFMIKLLAGCGGKCKETSSTQARSSTSSRSLRSSLDATTSTNSSMSSDTDSTIKQSCELSGLHVLRASIRDQEGKKYVIILSQSEGWKVAVGLQKLRRGSLVQAFGVAGMPMNEAKAILENLGFT